MSYASQSKKILGFVFILGWFLSSSVLATPRLKIEPPEPTLPEDRTATLKIILEWAPGEGPYELSGPEPLSRNLTLLKQSQSQESGSVLSSAIIYEFQPVRRGNASILRFDIRYRPVTEESWSTFSVPEQNLTIVGAFPKKKVAVAAGILGGFFVGLWIIHAIRKMAQSRSSAKKAKSPDSKQRVYGQAEEAIATFTAANPNEKLQHWSAQLKTVVQTYYDIPSKVATEAEILAFLKTRPLKAEEFFEISNIFSELAQIKFAKQELSAYELDRLQKTLLQYIRGKIIIEKLDS